MNENTGSEHQVKGLIAERKRERGCLFYESTPGRRELATDSACAPISIPAKVCVSLLPQQQKLCADVATDF